MSLQPLDSPTSEAVSKTARYTKRFTFRQRDQLIGFLFVAPVLLFFVVFFVYPAIAAFYYSFTSWNMRNDPVWVGLDNYNALFFDNIKYPNFWHSLFVTFQYIIFAVPLSLVGSLTFALLINGARRGQTFFKLVFYLPVITSEAAVAVIWRWVYDPLTGLLNMSLKLINVKPVNWLNEPNAIMPALAIIALWQSGGSLIVFLAGLRGISAELYEASRIDGASGWQQLRYMTLPLLTPTTFYLVVTSLIASFQVFGIVYVLFSIAGGGLGGPKGSALVYVLELYNHAFRYSEMGVACAMSFILFVIILIVTYIQFRFMRQSYD